ncbi:MAG: hypothetical protein WD226_11060 [Planctomycetota bacterium]
MTRAIVGFAVLFGALFAWDRALSREARVKRAARTRVDFVIPPERRQALPVAALRVEIPGEPELLLARVKGDWRALSYERAHADRVAVAALVRALTETQGTIVSEDPAAAQQYGIGGGRSVVVTLAGPKVLDDPAGDVLEAFELGRSLGERGAGFLRRRGSPAIWRIESDPKALLAPRAAPGLPPLLDPAVIPGTWNGWAAGLADVFVDHADGTSLHLERRLRDPATDPPAAGETPWRWWVGGDDDFPAAPTPARGYELFLARAPFVEVVDASRAQELGLETPATRLTLAADGLEPLEVLIGVPLADERVPVFAPALGRLVLVTPAVARLLAPPAAWLDPADPRNLWDPYLRETRR